MTKKSKRGGLRNPPGGKPRLPEGQKRQKVSPTLAPDTKELAMAIAKEKGLPGWGHAIDQAIAEFAEKLNISL